MNARVLVFDIEVSPILAYTWSLKPYSLPIDFIVEDPRLLCIGAMWLGEKKVSLLSEWEHGRQGMLEGIHKLFSECDVAAGYNSKSFDVPWVLGELAREGFAPPSPFQQVDLYRESRQWRFPSHKLQAVSTRLGLEGKLSTGGFSLWKDVLAGDPKAQAKMGRYCKQDVRLTGELYEAMAPWLKTSPVHSLYTDDESDALTCPRCGSDDVQRRGFAFTRLGKFARFQCVSCGGWSRGKRNLKAVDVR